MRRLFAAALALLGLWVARDYLVALAWAILIALAAWPLYRRFAASMPERRTLAPAVFTMLASLVLLVPLALIVVEVGREAQTALRWLAEAQQSGIPTPDWLAGIPVLGRFIEVWWHDHLRGHDDRGTDPHDLLASLGDHLGLKTAHVGAQIPADLSSFVSQHPERIASLPLCEAATSDAGLDDLLER